MTHRTMTQRPSALETALYGFGQAIKEKTLKRGRHPKQNAVLPEEQAALGGRYNVPGTPESRARDDRIMGEEDE